MFPVVFFIAFKYEKIFNSMNKLFTFSGLFYWIYGLAMRRFYENHQK
jgi:hypothetical protein